MKIWMVCLDPGIPLGGTKGSAIHLGAIARAFAELGHEILLFCARVEADPEIPGVEIADVNPQDGAGRRRNGDKAARERYAMDLNQPLAAALERRLVVDGPPDLCYERYSLWSCAAARFCAEREIPFALEVNAPLVEEEARYRDLQDAPRAREVEQTVCQAARKIFVVSPALREHLRARQVAQGKIHVVANGVCKSWLRPDGQTAKRTAEPRPIRVGFLGSLRPWHGLETLLEAAALAPRGQMQLEIAGVGPMLKPLKKRAVELAISEIVNWHGAIRHEAVPAFLDSIDIAVAPYPDLNPFYFSPIKIYEYGARAKPVICSRVGHLSDAFRDDEVVFVEAESAQALAGAVATLAADTALCDRLGANLCAKVARRHTWEAIAREIIHEATPARSARPVR